MRQAVNRQSHPPATPLRRLWLVTACCLLPAACFSGCMTLNNRTRTPPPIAAEPYTETPKAEQLVKYLNDNAARITALDSNDLDMDIQAGKQQIGVQGTLHCQKPRNFRLVAKAPVVRQSVADFGSNDQEFWYWIRDDVPPGLKHCSYADLSRGNVPLPFPFQPEFVLEALGMATRNPAGNYDPVQRKERTLELVERTTSLQGEPIVKVTVFNNLKDRGSMPVILEHRVYDAQSRPVCRATVLSVQQDRATQITVPHKVRLEWPAQQITLTLTLGDIAVNSPKSEAITKRLFSRPHLNVKEIDLAQGLSPMAPVGIQRAGAYR